MSNYTYPLDMVGDNPTNLVAGQLVVGANPNIWNCFIPAVAPFHRNSLILTHVETGRVLVEGIDYYLGHYFKELTDIAKRPAFGSFMLIDNTLTGSINYQLQTFGDRYIPAPGDIDKYLASDNLPNPRNTDFREVYQVYLNIPPVNTVDNITEAIAMDSVTGKLEEIRNTINSSHDERLSQFNGLLDRVEALRPYATNNSLEMHTDLNNPHAQSASDVGAYGEEQKVADALRAFNLTYSNLRDYVETAGFDKSVADRYLDLSGGIIEGRFIVKDNAILISHASGSAMIDITSGSINFSSNDNFVIKADSDSNKSAIAATLKTAINQLQVFSGGSNINDSSVAFNNRKLITEDMVASYVRPPSSLLGVIYIDTASNGDDHVILAGLGADISPLSIELTDDIADTIQKGRVFLWDKVELMAPALENNTYDGNPITYGVSTKAIDEAHSLVNLTYVPKSLTINNKEIGSGLNLSSSDFSDLNNVDNTSSANKPASDSFLAEVANKISSTHVHPESEWAAAPRVPDTPGGTPGIGEFAHSFPNTTVGEVASPFFHKRFEDAWGNSLIEKSKRMPANLLDIQQFGGNDYMKLPLEGSYPPSGASFSYLSGAGALEENRFVFLRSSTGEDGEGAYYCYSLLDANGDLMEPVITTNQYVPDWLPSNYYVFACSQGSDGVFIANTKYDDGNSIITEHWVVLTYGTMDSSKHKAMKIHTSQMTLSESCQPIIIGDKVYFSSFNGASNIYNIGLGYVTVAEIEAATANDASVEVNMVNLYGKDVLGNDLAPAVIFKPISELKSSGANVASYYRVLPGGEVWTGFSIVHGGGSKLMALTDGKKIRLSETHTSYYYNPKVGRTHTSASSYLIDPETGEVIMDNPDDYPISLDDSSAYPTNTTNISQECGHGGRINIAIYNDRRLGLTRWYTESFLIEVSPPDENDGLSWFDRMDVSRKLSYPVKDRYKYFGKYGSPVTNTQVRFGWYGNDRLSSQCKDTGLVEQRYDVNGDYGDGLPALGPTVDRITRDGDDLNPILRVAQCYQLFNGTIERRYNAGGCIDASGKTSETKLDINGNATSDDIVMPDSVFNNILNQCHQAFIIDEPPSTLVEFVDHELTVTIFGDHDDAVNPELFLVLHTYAILYRVADGSLHGKQIYIIGNATGTITGTTNKAFSSDWTADISDGKVYRSSKTKYNALQLYPSLWNQSIMFYNRNDNDVYLIAGNTPQIQYVGYGQRWHPVIKFDLDTKTIQGVFEESVYAHKAYGIGWHPETGFYKLREVATYEAVYANTYSNWDKLVAGTPNETNFIISSSRVAEGWIIYFTEQINFYSKNKLFRTEVTQFDLRDLPNHISSYLNTRIEIYIKWDQSIEDGNLEYVFYNYLLDFSNPATYRDQIHIGYILTDTQGITTLELNRYTSIDNIYEMHRHELEMDGIHGYDDSGQDASQIRGAEHIVNAPMQTTPRDEEDFWEFWHYNRNIGSLAEHTVGSETLTFNEAGNGELKCPSYPPSLHMLVSKHEVFEPYLDVIISSDQGVSDGSLFGMSLVAEENGVVDTLDVVFSLNRLDPDNIAARGFSDHAALILNYGTTKQQIIQTFNEPDLEYATWDSLELRFVISPTRQGISFTIERADGVGGAISSTRPYYLSTGAYPLLAKFEHDKFKFAYRLEDTYGVTIKPNSRTVRLLDYYAPPSYAAASMVQEVFDQRADEMLIRTGQIVPGNSIPVPEGCERVDTKVILRLRSGSGREFNHYDLNYSQTNGTVTATAKDTYGDAIDQSLLVLDYTLVALKPFK